MSGEPTIEKKTYTEEQAKRVLLTALRGKDGQLTRADAVALSGLPVPDAEQALTSLLKEYRSHLSATESGELVYEFDPAFERRDAIPLTVPRELLRPRQRSRHVPNLPVVAVFTGEADAVARRHRLPANKGRLAPKRKGSHDGLSSAFLGKVWTTDGLAGRTGPLTKTPWNPVHRGRTQRGRFRVLAHCAINH
jgi:hypothetical protein